VWLGSSSEGGFDIKGEEFYESWRTPARRCSVRAVRRTNARIERETAITTGGGCFARLQTGRGASLPLRSSSTRTCISVSEPSWRRKQDTGVLSLLWSLISFDFRTHGLRRGLHTGAASRLDLRGGCGTLRVFVSSFLRRPLQRLKPLVLSILLARLKPGPDTNRASDNFHSPTLRSQRTRGQD
jgi:hypothetical protein